MIIRSLSGKDYYPEPKLLPGPPSPDDKPIARLAHTIAMTGPTMAQFIARYAMAGKRVLSVGAGTGHEEYWFHRAGGDVTLLDSGEFCPAVLARVQSLPEGGPDTRLRYVFEDYVAYAETPEAADSPLDLAYFSGLRPDELRREAIQQLYWEGRPSSASPRAWPQCMPVFTDAVLRYGRLLAPQGLLAVQSYRGGVNLVTNPLAVDLAAAQFREHGLDLLEIHFFRGSPAISLYVGCRLQDAADWRARLAEAAPLACFHGRYGDEAMKWDIGRIDPAVGITPIL